MMKIALTGAHGTGKTTLAAALRNYFITETEFHSVSICREVPRIITELIQEDDFFKRDHNTPLRQSLIFLYQVIEDHLVTNNADIVITDRTMVDHLAYTLVLFPYFRKKKEYAIIHEATVSWMQTYKYIFKLPIEFSIVGDGVRENDAMFQAEIDAKINSLYQEFGMEPIRISGSVRDRIRCVANSIDLAN